MDNLLLYLYYSIIYNRISILLNNNLWQSNALITNSMLISFTLITALVPTITISVIGSFSITEPTFAEMVKNRQQQTEEEEEDKVMTLPNIITIIMKYYYLARL
jgi:predicted membrane protein